MKNLLTRTLTGFAFVAVILGSLLLGPFAYAVVFATVLIAALIEFYSLFNQSQYQPNKVAGFTVGFIGFVLSFLICGGFVDSNYLFLLPFLFLLILGAELYRKKEFSVENMALTVFALVYLALPLSLINELVYLNGNTFFPHYFIAVLAIIWIYDSGAYLFGVPLGKHRLFERISPKKSWEGAIGGALVAIASSVLIQKLVPQLDVLNWIILSALIVVSSTFGDLTESLIKRQFGVKDSGSFFPGHGGFLDRFDSLLFAIPMAVVYLKLVIE